MLGSLPPERRGCCHDHTNTIMSDIYLHHPSAAWGGRGLAGGYIMHYSRLRRGQAWHGTPWPGAARPGVARQGRGEGAPDGALSVFYEPCHLRFPGLARLALAGHGAAGPGSPRSGRPWFGSAEQDAAWQGRRGTVGCPFHQGFSSKTPLARSPPCTNTTFATSKQSTSFRCVLGRGVVAPVSKSASARIATPLASANCSRDQFKRARAARHCAGDNDTVMRIPLAGLL
jgi:hypothetical protein